jgi:hypothetical protein
MNGDTAATLERARRWLITECVTCAAVLASNKNTSLKRNALKRLTDIYAAIQAIDLVKKAQTKSARSTNQIPAIAEVPSEEV